jgi:Ca2+-binding protein (EF-Hand superfamily)
MVFTESRKYFLLFYNMSVLSVVFQTYIHSMKILRERAAVDRQESMKLAFLALKPVNTNIRIEDDGDDHHELSVETAKVRKVIQTLRPHYSSEKIDVLVQIVDPNRNGMIEYNDFRARMPIVLRTSLRSARSASRHSMVLSSVNVGVAILNMFYVLLFSSSPLEFVLLSNLIFPMGTIITLVGLLEVMARLRPCAFLNSLSTARHGVLDTLAMIAGIVSMIGIISHTMKDTKGLQWLLLGRAIGKLLEKACITLISSIVQSNL